MDPNPSPSQTASPTVSLPKRSLWLIDLDDTLFHTDVVIRAYKRIPCRGRGETLELVAQIPSSQYKCHNHDPELEYDFSDFRCEKKFIDSAYPIGNNWQRILDMGAVYGDRAIVTARETMNNQLYFCYHLRHKLNDDALLVYCTGDLGIGKAPENKQACIKQMLNMSNLYDVEPYDDVWFFDDCEKNLTKFLELKSAFPAITFHAYHVQGTEFVKFNLPG